MHYNCQWCFLSLSVFVNPSVPLFAVCSLFILKIQIIVLSKFSVLMLSFLVICQSSAITGGGQLVKETTTQRIITHTADRISPPWYFLMSTFLSTLGITCVEPDRPILYSPNPLNGASLSTSRQQVAASGSIHPHPTLPCPASFANARAAERPIDKQSRMATGARGLYYGQTLLRPPRGGLYCGGSETTHREGSKVPGQISRCTRRRGRQTKPWQQ